MEEKELNEPEKPQVLVLSLTRVKLMRIYLASSVRTILFMVHQMEENQLKHLFYKCAIVQALVNDRRVVKSEIQTSLHASHPRFSQDEFDKAWTMVTALAS